MLEGPVDLILRALVVVGLVLLNGLFVASEFALVSVRRSRIQELADGGNRTARLILQCLDDPNRFVSTAQVGITIASLALGWVGEPAVAAVLEGPLESIGVSTHAVSVVIAFAIITFLHVVAGEIAPKGLALANSERVAFALVYPISWCFFVLRPIIWGLNRSAEMLLRLFGVPGMVPGRIAHSEEELRILVAESREGGVLDESEQEMLHNVFDFADKAVADVMVPRPDVVALPLDESPVSLLQKIVEQPYTRYPVYRETHDDIVGILHIRDLFKAAERVGKARVRLDNLLRPAHVVPETKPLGGLLADFRRSKSHMALVVDEYGSLAGIVTLEDLLEEIVGEIDDEHDLPESPVEKIGDGHLRVDGKFPLEELADDHGVRLPSGDFHTVGGFVFGLLGQAPQEGDVVRFENLRFEVTETDGPRIVTVDILRVESVTDADEGPASSDQVADDPEPSSVGD